jgi:hypothetical protein
MTMVQKPTDFLSILRNSAMLLQRTNHLRIAFIAFLLYDHLITLDKEVEWIWTLRWRLPKIIFLINRYILSSFIVLFLIPENIFPLPLSFCNFLNKFIGWLPIFNFFAAELMMIIRVASLYGHRKLVVWSLSGLFVLSLTSSIATQVLYMDDLHTFLDYKFLPGCSSWIHESSDIEWRNWVPSLWLEGVLMLLTAYKVISYRNTMNVTITILARDSVAYFVLVFVGLVLAVADAIHTFIKFPVLEATVCIVSIAVGRMMMNIRGLIMDDPEHTVHLQTLEFASCHDSGLETEEGAWTRYGSV